MAASSRSSFAWGVLGGILGGMAVVVFVALLWAWIFGPLVDAANAAYEDAGYRSAVQRERFG